MSQPPPRVNHSLMYLPSDSINTPVMISQQPIPESNFNIPQETNDAYHTSATHLDNFNPFNDSTASIPGRLSFQKRRLAVANGLIEFERKKVH